jgi:hypothetical protein
MTASMHLEVVAADGSAIDRAGKMDCTRGGTATRVLSMGTGAGSEKGCSVNNQAFCGTYCLDARIRLGMECDFGQQPGLGSARSDSGRSGR